MLKRLEKINIIIITAGLIVLSCLIIYTGLYNLFTNDYTSLGDPYHTNQILAFKRAPHLIWTTLIIFVFILIQGVIIILEKKYFKGNDKPQIPNSK